LTPVKITNDLIEEIKLKLDIVDVISEWVSLKKTGANYKGCCPFHNEKTPSFVVSPDKQIFHCFGCNTGGDLISFVEKIENLNFPETVTKLAEKAGVEIKRVNYDPKTIEKISKQKEFLDINTKTRDFFINNLKKNLKSLNYLSSRKIDEKIINDFYIGYAREEWESLSDYFKKENISLSKASELGLVKEKNGRYYDTFRKRIIFPILDHRSNTVAFGARVLENKKDVPKYINSKDSFIYTKGDVLYGLHKTANKIREKEYAIVVEGYTDLLSLYQVGIKNVVATLGTAFTEKQTLLLKRYTNKVVLFYDSDSSGIKASKRSLELLLKKGFDVRGLFLEEGMDPDEAVKLIGKNELIEKIEKSCSLVYKVIVDSFSDIKNPSDLASSIDYVVSVLSNIPNELEQKQWLNEVCIRSGFSIQDLSKVLKKYKNKEVKNTGNNKSINFLDKINDLDKKLIKIVLFKNELCFKVFDQEWEKFLPNYIRDLFFEIKQELQKTNKLSLSDLLLKCKKNDLNWLENIISEALMGKDTYEGLDIEKEFQGCILKYKIKLLEKQKNSNLSKIKNNIATDKTLREHQAVVEEINKTKKLLSVFE
jgi:DNA primase